MLPLFYLYINQLEVTPLEEENRRIASLKLPVYCYKHCYMDRCYIFCVWTSFLWTHQWISIRPAEIILNGFIVQASPLILFVVAWRGQKAFTLTPPVEINEILSTGMFLTHCWCSAAPQGSWWTPDELPACDSAALPPPSSGAGWSVGSRSRGTCPSQVHTAPGLKAAQRMSQTGSVLVNVHLLFLISMPILLNLFTDISASQRSKRTHQSHRGLLHKLANRDIWFVHPGRCRCLRWDRGRSHRHLKKTVEYSLVYS